MKYPMEENMPYLWLALVLVIFMVYILLRCWYRKDRSPDEADRKSERKVST